LKAFIDTSAFCALAIPKDRHNLEAKALYKKLKEQKAYFYTSAYVLDEAYTLLKMRGSYKTAVNFMDQMDESYITILRVNEEVEKAAKKIFRCIDDKKLSFTDCTSFALINMHAMDAAFAFDEHFRYHPYAHPVEFRGNPLKK